MELSKWGMDFRRPEIKVCFRNYISKDCGTFLKVVDFRFTNMRTPNSPAERAETSHVYLGSHRVLACCQAALSEPAQTQELLHAGSFRGSARARSLRGTVRCRVCRAGGGTHSGARQSRRERREVPDRGRCDTRNATARPSPSRASHLHSSSLGADPPI